MLLKLGYIIQYNWNYFLLVFQEEDDDDLNDREVDDGDDEDGGNLHLLYCWLIIIVKNCSIFP